MVMVDVEVIDTQLDYNILLGRSYMYAMKGVSSSVFHIMMFSFNGNVVTLDECNYYTTPMHLQILKISYPQ